MKIIYKYQLLLTPGRVRIRVPYVGEIIHTGEQNGMFTLWYLHDPNYESRKYLKFEIYATGQPIEESHNIKHVNSVQEGPYVWHVFLVEE
jgi:hypothetical protein